MPLALHTRPIELTTKKKGLFYLQKGARNYRLVELHSNLKWDSFADGWPNIFIENVKEIAGRDGRDTYAVIMYPWY